MIIIFVVDPIVILGLLVVAVLQTEKHLVKEIFVSNWYVNETDRGTVNPQNVMQLNLYAEKQGSAFWTYTDEPGTTTKETTTFSYHGNANREGDGATFYTYVDESQLLLRKLLHMHIYQTQFAKAMERNFGLMSMSLVPRRKKLLHFRIPEMDINLTSLRATDSCLWVMSKGLNCL